MQRLLLENARLSAHCAQNSERVAQYELLLREGDHRIKNSLQIVASLLHLQARRVRNTDARAAIETAAGRIVAVARVHDSLRLDSDIDTIDVGALIETMGRSLQVVAAAPSSARIVVDAQSILAPLALAQPVVLVVNELVINALRHAFPDGRAGAVVVTVTQHDHELVVSVADNGVGLPAGFARSRGYGMTLVHAMVAKTGGTLLARNSGGAHFTLTAPLNAPNEASVFAGVC